MTTGARTPQTVDAELRQRMRRYSGSMTRMLSEWVKDRHGQALLLGSRGAKGENYLQYLLAQRDKEVASALIGVSALLIETTLGGVILEFLNHVDQDGNGVWHYLARATEGDEDPVWLELIGALAKLQIDIRRKNAGGDNAIVFFATPKPRWPALNALAKGDLLTIEELVAAFNLGQAEDERAKRLGTLLASDIADNGGEVCQALISHADNAATTRKERAACVRAFFQCPAGDAEDTAFLKLLETDLAIPVERLAKVVQANAAEETGTSRGAPRQQLWLFKRIQRQNRMLYGPLAKAVIANRPAHLAVLQDLMRNEDLSVVIDAGLPAPSNPWLSLMLQQDALGNTPLHAAVMWGRPECLTRLIGDLSMIDLNLMLRAVPNRFNLTVVDLSLPAAAHAKLGMEVQAKRITIEAGGTIFAQIQKFHQLTQKPLNELVKRATEGAAKAAASGTKPGFDLAKIASVQYLKRAGVS
jgi:hypothetical protein